MSGRVSERSGDQEGNFIQKYEWLSGAGEQTRTADLLITNKLFTSTKSGVYSHMERKRSESL
jgi:hypothetical protein